MCVCGIFRLCKLAIFPESWLMLNKLYIKSPTNQELSLQCYLDGQIRQDNSNTRNSQCQPTNRS